MMMVLRLDSISYFKWRKEIAISWICFVECFVSRDLSLYDGNGFFKVEYDLSLLISADGLRKNGIVESFLFGRAVLVMVAITLSMVVSLRHASPKVEFMAIH